MALFFGFSTPETVLMMVAGKGSAGVEHAALQAHRACHRLASFTRLRTLGNGREEDLGEATALGGIHPGVIGPVTTCEVFHRHPLSPFR